MHHEFFTSTIEGAYNILPVSDFYSVHITRDPRNESELYVKHSHGTREITENQKLQDFVPRNVPHSCQLSKYEQQ